MIRILPFALLASLMGAPLAARDRPAPVATPDGPPVSCISMPIGQSVVRDDRTIDFFVGRKVYRNVLPQACPGLGSEKAFSYNTSISRLCSVDLITVLQRVGGQFMRGATCGLGPFQPATGIKR
ncbi:hypothetical protein HL653_05120 [Sphingomonas sp. AP4-R1]|uniref:hypothetical protein n=1 Tax=Sphingomonas sp. AP4-R1 TaxID=2735134 RepID=UPI001493CA38|nr:hypothetical protein [Sphingomonas sp. AP4-R1]QJU57258.1 hypothetical protein HL653_05120 [Sphingomonas sp. AP4-R1]